MIRVFGFWPLPVGIVPFHDGLARLGVVLKQTFAIPEIAGERAFLAATQRPLKGDESHPFDAARAAEDLAYAADLVPPKARVDVTLAGSAWSLEPAAKIPIRFTVAGLARELVALAATATDRIPLIGAHLRDEAGAQVRVGAGRPTGARLRRPRRANPAEAAFGPFVLDLARAEDGSGYQSAPPEQQLPKPFDVQSEFFFSGMGRPGASGIERWFWLAPTPPFLFAERPGRGPIAIPLACDTVHIDLDGGTIEVVHRGIYPHPPKAGEVVDLFVGVAGPAAPKSPAEAVSRAHEAQPLPHCVVGPTGDPLPVAAPEARGGTPDLSGFAGEPSSTVALEVTSAMPSPKAGLQTFDETPLMTSAVDLGKIIASLPFRGGQGAPGEAAAPAPVPPPLPAPVPGAPPASTPSSGLASFDSGPDATSEFTVGTLPSLPFAPASQRGGWDPPPEDDEGGQRTRASAPVVTAPPIPFQPSPPVPPAPPSSPQRRAVDEDDEGGTGTLALDASGAAALLAAGVGGLGPIAGPVPAVPAPVAASRVPPVPAPVAPPPGMELGGADSPWARRTAGQQVSTTWGAGAPATAASSAAPVAPEPELPPPTRAPLTLEEFADVSVALADRAETPRSAVLARFGLDLIGWAVESARWTRVLDAEAARSSTQTLEALLARARARQGETSAQTALRRMGDG